MANFIDIVCTTCGREKSMPVPATGDGKSEWEEQLWGCVRDDVTHEHNFRGICPECADLDDDGSGEDDE
jgi:hypothetical protein